MDGLVLCDVVQRSALEDPPKLLSLEGEVRMEGGVVAGGLVDHTHQHGALFYIKVYRVFGEEGLGGGLDAICAAAEEDGVQVHIHYLFLGVVPFELDGGDPLLELYPDHLYLRHAGNPAAYVGPGIERLGELLGEGAAAALGGVAPQEGAVGHAAQGPEVDAGVVVEALVFGGYGGLDHIGRELVVADVGAVFDVEGRQDLPVFGYYLGGELAFRVFQFGE